MNYDTIKVYCGDWKVTGINADNSCWYGGDIQLQHDGHRWRCALTNANYPHKTPICYWLTGQIKDCLRYNQRLILDLRDGTSIYVRDCPQIQDLALDLIQIKADVLSDEGDCEPPPPSPPAPMPMPYPRHHGYGMLPGPPGHIPNMSGPPHSMGQALPIFSVPNQNRPGVLQNHTMPMSIPHPSGPCMLMLMPMPPHILNQPLPPGMQCVQPFGPHDIPPSPNPQGVPPPGMSMPQTVPHPGMTPMTNPQCGPSGAMPISPQCPPAAGPNQNNGSYLPPRRTLLPTPGLDGVNSLQQVMAASPMPSQHNRPLPVQFIQEYPLEDELSQKPTWNLNRDSEDWNEQSDVNWDANIAGSLQRDQTEDIPSLMSLTFPCTSGEHSHKGSNKKKKKKGGSQISRGGDYAGGHSDQGSNKKKTKADVHSDQSSKKKKKKKGGSRKSNSGPTSTNNISSTQ